MKFSKINQSACNLQREDTLSDVSMETLSELQEYEVLSRGHGVMC